MISLNEIPDIIANFVIAVRFCFLQFIIFLLINLILFVQNIRQSMYAEGKATTEL